MLHRIRLAMEAQSFTKSNGTVEVDETFVGGDAKNMHKHIRERRVSGPTGHKTPVQGIRDRDHGTIRAAVVKGTMREHIEEWVEPGANIYTDEAKYHQRLSDHYSHKFVTHANEYVSGVVHTNGVENFWSLLKRAIKGTQVHVSPEHLDRYVAERVFAYNHRATDDLGRLRLATTNVGNGHLTYAALTERGRAKRTRRD